MRFVANDKGGNGPDPEKKLTYVQYGRRMSRTNQIFLRPGGKLYAIAIQKSNSSLSYDVLMEHDYFLDFFLLIRCSYGT
jgi:hypothetical protein